jgi:hypothetical protein
MSNADTSLLATSPLSSSFKPHHTRTMAIMFGYVLKGLYRWVGSDSASLLLLSEIVRWHLF